VLLVVFVVFGFEGIVFLLFLFFFFVPLPFAHVVANINFFFFFFSFCLPFGCGCFIISEVVVFLILFLIDRFLGIFFLFLVSYESVVLFDGHVELFFFLLLLLLLFAYTTQLGTILLVLDQHHLY